MAFLLHSAYFLLYTEQVYVTVDEENSDYQNIWIIISSSGILPLKCGLRTTREETLSYPEIDINAFLLFYLFNRINLSDYDFEFSKEILKYLHQTQYFHYADMPTFMLIKNDDSDENNVPLSGLSKKQIQEVPRKKN